MAWIYILTFPNGKQYIGQTTNIKNRFSQHRRDKKNLLVSNAIRKYGWDFILKDEIRCPEEFLDEVEIAWIKNFDTLFPNGYNIETGSNKNKHLSEETKKKISKSKKGEKYSYQTEEWKKEQAEKMKGNTFAIGKKKSEKWTEGMIGKKYALGHKFNPSSEYKKNMSEIMKGKKNSLGNKVSNDVRKKISKSMKRVWAERKTNA